MNISFTPLAQRFRFFIKQNPALELALLGVFSISVYLEESYILVPMVIFFSLMGLKKSLFVYPSSILAILMALHLFYGGHLSQGEAQGKGLIHIENVSYRGGFFGSNWVYTGVVKKFSTEDRIYKNIPFTLYRKGSLSPLDASSDYEVFGTLKKKETYGYGLKVAPSALFIKVPKSFSFAQKRYLIKEKFKSLLYSRIPFKGAGEFLIGISIGDFSNSFLSFTFSRFGLNHLLAISGFHFGVLLLFLNTLLAPFFPSKIKTLVLIIALSLFYFIVGNGPSLSRAWIAAVIYLAASLFDQQARAVNTLSLSMVIILFLNPLMLTHLGFQFSFLVTYGILLYYGRFYLILKKWLPPDNQIHFWLIKAYALGLSVHLAAVPLTLFYFHKFYLLSFFYNLFIPTLVGGLIFILLTALLLHLIIPWVAAYFFYLVGYLTEHLLKILYWIPTSLDYSVRVPFFPLVVLFVYLSLFLVVGSLEPKQQEVELKLSH